MKEKYGKQLSLERDSNGNRELRIIDSNEKQIFNNFSIKDLGEPVFGPLCMFGLGGIFVEALKDVTFRLAPMWELSAENMIRSIKAYKVLKGLRGKPPSDIEAIKNCILRLSQLVSGQPEISELDINPLIVYPENRGCRVADSRIVLVR